jgi:hypothetical protein
MDFSDVVGMRLDSIETEVVFEYSVDCSVQRLRYRCMMKYCEVKTED